MPVKAGVIPDSVIDLRKGFLYSGSAILVAGGGIFTKCQNILTRNLIKFGALRNSWSTEGTFVLSYRIHKLLI